MPCLASKLRPRRQQLLSPHSSRPKKDHQNDRPDDTPADPCDVRVSRLPFENLLMEGHQECSVLTPALQIGPSSRHFHSGVLDKPERGGPEKRKLDLVRLESDPPSELVHLEVCRIGLLQRLDIGGDIERPDCRRWLSPCAISARSSAGFVDQAYRVCASDRGDGETRNEGNRQIDTRPGVALAEVRR